MISDLNPLKLMYLSLNIHRVLLRCYHLLINEHLWILNNLLRRRSWSWRSYNYFLRSEQKISITRRSHYGFLRFRPVSDRIIQRLPIRFRRAFRSKPPAAGGDGRRQREEKQTHPRRLRGHTEKPIVLVHHVLEIVFVSHRDQRVEIFSRELVLERDLPASAVSPDDGGELRGQSGEPDAAIDG